MSLELKESCLIEIINLKVIYIKIIQLAANYKEKKTSRNKLGLQVHIKVTVNCTYH